MTETNSRLKRGLINRNEQHRVEMCLRGICGERRPRSDCASAQSDQDLRCPLSESFIKLNTSGRTQPRKPDYSIGRDLIKPSFRFPLFCAFFSFKGNLFLFVIYTPFCSPIMYSENRRKYYDSFTEFAAFRLV